MTGYHQNLLPGETYHLFSRAVGSEKIFLYPENYLFFLQKLRHHTSGVCRLYCYALMPNHFHLLALMREEEVITKHFEEVKKIKFNPSEHDLSDFIMERFSNFLNSYTKAFNKVNNRNGALFMDYLKRSKVSRDSDFTSYVWYLHKNAVHHQLAKIIGEWPYDSYLPLLSSKPTSLLRDEVIEWFGSKQAFIEFHNRPVEPKINILDM